MKPASEGLMEEPVAAASTSPAFPIEPGFVALLIRLDQLSKEPSFHAQREAALGVALRPYADYGPSLPLIPLPEEVALAQLYLFADYLPSDGQSSLIEQVRDLVEVHVPEEERVWLDPLRHSFMDLLAVEAVDPSGSEGTVALKSLGGNRTYRVPLGSYGRSLKVGQALLTRLVRTTDRVIVPGVAVRLSGTYAHWIFKAADQWRRLLEARSGEFSLGEWEEFAKTYGYVLLWQLAQARLGALIKGDEAVRYRTEAGRPFLYALACYDHRAARLLADGLAEMAGMVEIRGGAEADAAVRTWLQRDPVSQEVAAQVTVTPDQLHVECESRERLDQVKHQLASAFGYSLHFRGESTRTPPHLIPPIDLEQDDVPSPVLTVSAEQERQLVADFLSSVYLDWTDKPSPALENQTPRHAAASSRLRAPVAALIDRLERDDLGRRRTGRSGYEYNRLRAQIGLPEVAHEPI